MVADMDYRRINRLSRLVERAQAHQEHPWRRQNAGRLMRAVRLEEKADGELTTLVMENVQPFQPGFKRI